MEHEPHSPDWKAISRALTSLTIEIVNSLDDCPELYKEYDEWLQRRDDYLRRMYGTE